MKRYPHKLHKQKGILALEPVILMLLFALTLMLANNGIVNVIRNEWYNTARSAAIAGAKTLSEETGNSNANQLAIDEALAFALAHQWLGRNIQGSQVAVSVGQWSNCIFTAGAEPANAVRVDISAPLDGDGSPTGITAFFGRIQAPMLETLPNPTTAVASVIDSTAVLVDFDSGVCIGSN